MIYVNKNADLIVELAVMKGRVRTFNQYQLS